MSFCNIIKNGKKEEDLEVTILLDTDLELNISIDKDTDKNTNKNNKGWTKIGENPNLDIDKLFQTLDYNQKLCVSLGAMDGSGNLNNFVIDGCNKSELSLFSGSKHFIKTMCKFFEKDILKDRYKIKSNIAIQSEPYKNMSGENSTKYIIKFTSTESIKAILTELYSTLSYNKLFKPSKYDKFLEFKKIHNFN